MDFKLDYAGMGRYLSTSPELAAALFKVADDGANKVRPFAPVGPPSDKHRGDYKNAIHAELSRNAKGDRIVSRIMVDVPYAAAEEWGNANRPGSRFLGETALKIIADAGG
jgi:hypothetical protein